MQNIAGKRWMGALAAALLLPAMALAGGHTGGGGAENRLNEADRARLQHFYNDFTTVMDEKYFGQVATMNATATVEDRFVENEWSDYELRVARGDVMEKAGRMLSDSNKLPPSRGDRIVNWERFYSLDMHPKTPLVGMLHATIVMGMFDDGSVQTGGWLGVMPGTRVEEDLALLKQITDDYFAAAGKDPALYRQLICKGTHDTRSEFRRKPACSGVSFYGPPVYPGDPEASIRFIAGLFDRFVGTYMDIVRERAADEFTAADIAAQDEMRRRWLIDQLFSDPFASSIVPFDVWSFANNPPVIKF